MPQISEAKNATWNQMYATATDVALRGCTSMFGGNCLGYQSYFNQMDVTVTYDAQLQDNTTNTFINNNDTVPVGNCVRVTPKPFASSDAHWFANPVDDIATTLPYFEGGPGLFDSPDGHWISNATPPPVSCSNQDYVGRQSYGIAGVNKRNLYAALSVNPPSVSIDSNGSTASVSNQGNGVYCFSGPGAAKINVTYPETTGKLYLRIAEVDIVTGNETSCTSDNEPMSIGNSTDPSSLTPFVMTVPQQTVTFTLNVSGAVAPPSGTPTDCRLPVGNTAAQAAIDDCKTSYGEGSGLGGFAIDQEGSLFICRNFGPPNQEFCGTDASYASAYISDPVCSNVQACTTPPSCTDGIQNQEIGRAHV